MPRWSRCLPGQRGSLFPDWYLVAGCLYQTVWNVVTGQPPESGILDYDLAYYDSSDLSWQAEDAIIQEGCRLFGDLPAPVQIRNQARVHHQLAVLQRRQPRRPSLNWADRALFATLLGRDTESAPPRGAAARHPGHDPALAPRYRPPPLGGAVQARQDRPSGNPRQHQVPGPPASSREPWLGVPQDSWRTGRTGSAGSGVDGVGDSEECRNRPRAAPIRACLAAVPARRPRRSWPATFSRPTCSTAPRLTFWPWSSTRPGASAFSELPNTQRECGPPS